MDTRKEKTVKTLKTDNDGEYTLTQLREYLKAEGIQHELSANNTTEWCCRTTEQNLSRDESFYALRCKTSKEIIWLRQSKQLPT